MSFRPGQVCECRECFSDEQRVKYKLVARLAVYHVRARRDGWTFLCAPCHHAGHVARYKDVLYVEAASG